MGYIFTIFGETGLMGIAKSERPKQSEAGGSERERERLKQLKKIVSESRENTKSFLFADPYTVLYRRSRNKSLSEREFREQLYAVSNKAEELIKAIKEELENREKAIFYFVGPRGCGKTTFIHELLHELHELEEEPSAPSYTLIDCETYSVYGGNERGIALTATELLRKAIIERLLAYQENDKNCLGSIWKFYKDNQFELLRLDAIRTLKNYREALEDAAGNTTASPVDNIENILAKCLDDGGECDLRGLIYILVLNIFASQYLSDNKKNTSKHILIFDNLDDVRDSAEVEKLGSLTSEMYLACSKVFPNLKLRSNSDADKTSFSDLFSTILVLRDITHAFITGPQTNDKLKGVIDPEDLSNIYDKAEIAKKRIERAKKQSGERVEAAKELITPELSTEAQNLILRTIEDLIDETEDLRAILNDDHFINSILMPMYNNSYYKAMKALLGLLDRDDTGRHSKADSYFKEYRKISTKRDKVSQEQGHAFCSDWKFGARGLLVKLLFDKFNTTKKGESCLSKIGVTRLTDRRVDEISVCRIILSYLSNKTETGHCDPHNGVSISELLADFDKLKNPNYELFKQEDILASLESMYSLQDNSHWTNLIAFRQFSFQKSLNSDGLKKEFSMTDFSFANDLDWERSTIYYSDAGKMYLQFVTSHFEFFSVRIFEDPEPPLFSSENYLHGSRKCIELIQRVFAEVETCCRILKTHNQTICETFGYYDEFYNEYPRKAIHYLDSHFNTKFKKENDSHDSYRMYHEEHIVLSHIRYIDAFRRFVLSESSSDGNGIDGPKMNEELVDIIYNYYDLLSKHPQRFRTRMIIPIKREQIEKIKAGDYIDYTTILAPNFDSLDQNELLKLWARHER
jgi:GTPase SAR1 family protein